MPQHMSTPAPVFWFCCASAFLGGARPLLLSPCNTCARAHGRARNAPATRALAGNPIIPTLLPARLCPQAGDGRACSLTPTSALSAYVQHGPAMCNVTYTDTYVDTYAHISKHTHIGRGRGGEGQGAGNVDMRCDYYLHLHLHLHMIWAVGPVH